MTTRAIEVFAPAKINLTLHVTGQRADGYHLLESVVMFGDVGDRLTVAPASGMSLRVIGPMADGVPDDSRNLCWKAAQAFGEPVGITLDKHLPAAAGIGGGSSDAAAVLNAMERLFGRPATQDVLGLGADVPVCRVGRAAMMSGIGEKIRPLMLPKLQAVLVNPRVSVATPDVFGALTTKENPPIAPLLEATDSAASLLQWLQDQRNDLEQPARLIQPIIGSVLETLAALDSVRLVRMSGSGATCFALFDEAAQAHRAAAVIQQQNPCWWVSPCVLQ
jgi:4-diphosphocytidyl-2-C-methyl-D-erythritol kinase